MAWDFHPKSYQSRQHYTATRRAVFSSMDIARVDVTITFGIRQGCPLAPLLIILAIDSVDWVLQAREDSRGVPITSGGRRTESKVSGYANDSAVYPCDRSAIMPIITILDDFNHVSGLWTNQDKPMVIELDPRGSAQPVSTCSITIQDPGDACRYLCDLVGQQVAVVDN